MPDNTQILLGDIGGTHVRFARFAGRGTYDHFKKYALDSADNFEELIRRYQDETGLLFACALFSVARTAVDGVIAYKRFAGDPDYRIDFTSMKQCFRWKNITYGNDLVAAAHGATIIQDNMTRIVILATKNACNAHHILTSIGTGVGHAFIINNGDVLGTHGGHMLPVTVTDEQRDVENFIRARKDMSLSMIAEDFVSARGLRMITEYVSGVDNTALSPTAFINHVRDYPIAIRLFFEFVGLHLHNLINVTGFYGGVYITGGVIDHLIAHDLTDWESAAKYMRPPMVSVVNDSLNGVVIRYVTECELPLLGLTILAANDKTISND